MRKISVSLILLVALLSVAGAVLASPTTPTNFVAHLSGAEEVPARLTLARGNAFFQLNDDGSALSFRLIAANVENIFASHIHCAPGGVAGPIGVTLFIGTPASGRFDGVLAQGEITSPDAGNACGWTTLQDVVDAMLSGDTYVNVHTNDGVAPTNTGAGDFPGGEIRGQISLAGSQP